MVNRKKPTFFVLCLLFSFHYSFEGRLVVGGFFSDPMITCIFFFILYYAVVQLDGRCVFNSKHLSLFFFGRIIPDSYWQILEVAQGFSPLFHLIDIVLSSVQWGTPRKVCKDLKTS